MHYYYWHNQWMEWILLTKKCVEGLPFQNPLFYYSSTDYTYMIHTYIIRILYIVKYNLPS